MESQYRNASNLNARVALHERFSTNAYGWQRWVFDQLELPPEASLLELGCGPGFLWKENLDRVPEGWSVTLTDASPGMLREAERALGADRRFHFLVVDAKELPFKDSSFDAVIANHMLYHVPDRPKAFSEITRVLRDGGTLYAATNGMKHLRELVGMLRVLDPTHSSATIAKDLPGFSLENGTEQLLMWFPEVSIRRYEDALVVTEARPLLNFLLSTMVAQTVSRRLSEKEFRKRVDALTAVLGRELASRGEIHITKDAGMFVARR